MDAMGAWGLVWVKVVTCEALVGLEGLYLLWNGGGAKEAEVIAGRHVLIWVLERHFEMEKSVAVQLQVGCSRE